MNISNERFVRQQIIQIGLELSELLRKNGYENVEGTLWNGEANKKGYSIEATAVRKGVYLPFSIELNYSEAYESPIGTDTVEEIVNAANTLVQRSTLDMTSYRELQEKIINRIQNLDQELKESRKLRKELRDDRVEEESSEI